ncbi:MAG: 4-hydroxy-tetrahydrodipicolinate synthase [Deltaproteobacteria bacterium]|jgi:4-hydroxy-tetrahydrodipicolinate synthase|nr:4-hydroxy-tetrahydrodipicolinate synthase [Deltaproteobacteria bacterium]
MIRGAIVAIVTPFRDGKVDEEGLRNLIEFQLENGTDAIVPCGTTGESATLDHAEHKMVVETTIDAVHGRVPVIAGTGSNSTAETIELTRHARSAGADAALVITPYYNKPTQEGLFQHFKAVSDACSFPMVLYNVPGRTSVNMLPATVARTAELDDVIGIKEATGSMQQASDIISLCGDKITVLSGDDFTAFPLLSIGGKGVISVVANVAPRDMADMVDAFEAGDMDKARGLHYKLFPLNKAMFYETNPIPAKTTLALMGKISGELRLPMFQMSEANLAKLKKTLTEYGLIP